MTQRTIHDEAAEKVELAKTYAEDGAFASAARIYREIADMYERRAEETYPDFKLPHDARD